MHFVKGSIVMKCSAAWLKSQEELAKCEWGHDDYSLKIENLPKAPEVAKPAPVNAGHKAKPKPRSSEPDLFGEAAP